MKKPIHNSFSSLVYSTNPDYKLENKEEEAAVNHTEQLLYIRLDRLKGNKIATVVENFKGSTNALNELAKILKTKCGSGGNAKEGEIIIQGEKRTQVTQLLNQMGYKTKQKGG